MLTKKTQTRLINITSVKRCRDVFTIIFNADIKKEHYHNKQLLLWWKRPGAIPRKRRPGVAKEKAGGREREGWGQGREGWGQH